MGTVRGGHGHLHPEARAHSSRPLAPPAHCRGVAGRAGPAATDTQLWGRLAVCRGTLGSAWAQRCAPNILTFKGSPTEPAWGLSSYYHGAQRQLHMCPCWPLGDRAPEEVSVTAQDIVLLGQSPHLSSQRQLLFTPASEPGVRRQKTRECQAHAGHPAQGLASGCCMTSLCLSNCPGLQNKEWPRPIRAGRGGTRFTAEQREAPGLA